MFPEELANAVLDNVHITYRDVIAGGDLLRGNLETLAEDKDIEVAARDVMVCLEYLKGIDESFCASFFIQGDSLESRDEGAFKFLRHGFNILGVNVGTILHVTEERAGLPTKIPKPVIFGLRKLLAV